MPVVDSGKRQEPTLIGTCFLQIRRRGRKIRENFGNFFPVK